MDHIKLKQIIENLAKSYKEKNDDRQSKYLRTLFTVTTLVKEKHGKENFDDFVNNLLIDLTKDDINILKDIESNNPSITKILCFSNIYSKLLDKKDISEELKNVKTTLVKQYTKQDLMAASYKLNKMNNWIVCAAAVAIPVILSLITGAPILAVVILGVVGFVLERFISGLAHAYEYGRLRKPKEWLNSLLDVISFDIIPIGHVRQEQREATKYVASIIAENSENIEYIDQSFIMVNETNKKAKFRQIISENEVESLYLAK